MNTHSVLLAYALRLMKEVESLDQYDGVVLGAAIYNTKWHADAHQFLSQLQAALQHIPVAMFTLGPLSNSVAAMRNSRRQLDKELMNIWRRVALILIVLADAGLLAWGAMAAVAPERLPGPDSTPILPAEYEGFTQHSWTELTGASPLTAEFITTLFRVYGAYIVAFGVLALAIAATAFRRGESWAWWALLVGNTIAYGSAMLYDRAVGIIGPFEMSEYIGLGAIYLALAVTAPFHKREA